MAEDVRAPRRRWRPLLTLIGVPFGLLALCVGIATVVTLFSSEGEDDPWAGAGWPVTRPTSTPPVPYYGGAAVSGLEGLQLVLASRVNVAAGQRLDTRTSCDTRQVQSRFTCRVRYRDETVTYTVTTRPRGGSTTLEFDAVADSVILTRSGIWNRVWWDHQNVATAIRCDEGLPELVRVPVHTQLDQRCYYKPKPDAQMGSTDGAWRRMTITVEDGTDVKAYTYAYD